MAFSRPSTIAFLGRIALPLFLFSAVLLVGAIVLAILFRPGRFPVRIGDDVMLIRDLETDIASLRKEETALRDEKDRVRSLAPSPTLSALDAIRNEDHPSFPAIDALFGVVARFVSSTNGNLQLRAVSFSSDAREIAVHGTVRDANGRTIPLVASFVDALRASGAFASVREPEYVQFREDDGASVSPFDLTVTLPSLP